MTTQDLLESLGPLFETEAPPNEVEKQVWTEVSSRYFYLPKEYVEFIAQTNGGEGPVGEDNYLSIFSAKLAAWYNVENYDSYHSAGVFVFASDGGNTLYAFNKSGEVVEFDQVGLTPYEAMHCGETFADFISGL